MKTLWIVLAVLLVTGCSQGNTVGDVSQIGVSKTLTSADALTYVLPLNSLPSGYTLEEQLNKSVYDGTEQEVRSNVQNKLLSQSLTTYKKPLETVMLEIKIYASNEDALNAWMGVVEDENKGMENLTQEGLATKRFSVPQIGENTSSVYSNLDFIGAHIYIVRYKHKNAIIEVSTLGATPSSDLSIDVAKASFTHIESLK